jgi:hypothetical protein
MNPFKENRDPKVQELFQLPDFDFNDEDELDLASFLSPKRNSPVSKILIRTVAQNSVQK